LSLWHFNLCRDFSGTGILHFNRALTGTGAGSLRPERQYGGVFAVSITMSNDLTVQPVSAVRSGSDVVGNARASPISTPSHAQLAPSSHLPNPNLRLDATLGLVVIEFRNERGAITESIPSERQLEAYQRWQTTSVGPSPAGCRSAATGAPGSSRDVLARWNTTDT
jgi:hypothetical protein